MKLKKSTSMYSVSQLKKRSEFAGFFSLQRTAFTTVRFGWLM
jgi:hypothetical protein